MADRLVLRLITPQREVLWAEVDEVMAPGATGGFGVRPGHTMFMTTLEAGPLVYRDGDARHAYAVVDGFVQVAHDEVSVLAEEIVPVEDIDLEAEERAIREARERMAKLAPGSDTYRQESALLRRSTARALSARMR